MKYILLIAVLCSFGCAMEIVPDPSVERKVQKQTVYDLQLSFAGSCRVTEGEKFVCVDIFSSAPLGKPECKGLFDKIPCMDLIKGD